MALKKGRCGLHCNIGLSVHSNCQTAECEVFGGGFGELEGNMVKSQEYCDLLTVKSQWPGSLWLLLPAGEYLVMNLAYAHMKCAITQVMLGVNQACCPSSIGLYTKINIQTSISFVLCFHSYPAGSLATRTVC